MSDPYIGEIRMFGGNFAPVGWAFCDGALVNIADNDTLYNLIGTTYGGDGVNTYALPDLRGRLPLHRGGGFVMGQPGGFDDVTLTLNSIAAHSHPLVGSTSNGTQASPANNVLASSTAMQPYRPGAADTPMATSAVSFVGGNQSHTNLQPYLCVSFIISLYGIYPVPN